MKTLYPALEPFHQFYLDTDSSHQVYVEQSGNPAGIPVIFLHGGPCSGTKPDHRRFFNPARYHIILMDQRGSGLSKPYGERQANTTDHLLADMEQIRQRLRLQQWLLFGGSWGVTLALRYAQQHPQRVSAMILRGSFLARPADMDWYLGENGVSRIYPDRWQALLDSVGRPQPDQLLNALCAAILGDDDNRARRAAQQWAQWGGQVALGAAFQASDEALSEREFLQVKLELHYAQHRYFIGDTPLLAHCQALQAIPTVIIHGQQDLTCPLEAGWCLHHALPHAQWTVVPDAGHIARGDSMIDALVSATDAMAQQL